jgi:uncharacterized membrane protein YhfC
VFTISFAFQFLILLGAPVALGFWLNRRLGLSWFLFFGGALAYVSAWVIASFLSMPGVVGAAFLSIIQMGALYLIYRFQLRTVRTEREALMTGLGQGGLEMMLLGIFAALSILQMSQLRNATDETLNSLAATAYDVAEEEIAPEKAGELRASIEDFWSAAWYGPIIHPTQLFIQVLPLRNLTVEELTSLSAKIEDVPEEDIDPENIRTLRAYIEDFWNTPWYGALVQPLQSLSFLPIQTALAVIVLGALTHGRWLALIGAMALHFLSQVLPRYGLLFGGPIVWLGISILFGGLALWFLRRLWPAIQAQTEAAIKEQRKAQKRAG